MRNPSATTDGARDYTTARIDSGGGGEPKSINCLGSEPGNRFPFGLVVGRWAALNP
jgi:hypothetical protein